MKRLRQVLCIFLAVMMLFFGVNNSYFSPHKMDTVEATSIVIGTGGVVITASMIIEFLCALAVVGLTAGLIIEWTDMDIEKIAEDLHDWCRENYEAIESYVAAQPAIRDWIFADEWVVVVDYANGSPEPNPSPSPSSDSEVENPPSTESALNKISQEQFDSLLMEHHGFTKAFRAVAGALGGGITVTSILTPLAMTEEAGRYQDENGELLDEDDPRIAPVELTEPYLNIASAYIADKVANFGNAAIEYDENGEPLDPITDALQYRYSGQVDVDNATYTGQLSNNELTSYTVVWTNVDASGAYAYYESYIEHDEGAIVRPYVFIDSSGAASLFYFVGDVSYAPYVTGYNIMPNGARVEVGSFKISGVYVDTWQSFGVNIPIFRDKAALEAYRISGDDSGCINVSKPQNYIDTDGNYGWASTADISPNDLLAAYPGLATDLTGKNISLPGLVVAINALRSQLEEQNPNDESEPVTNPLPYPDVPTYIETIKQIVNDPEIFPVANPVPGINPGTEPETNPGTETDTDTGTDTQTSPNYTGLLGIIINILQSILNLLKEFLSWFIIDFAVIKAYLLAALGSIPAFDGFEPVLGYIDDFRGSIGDGYDYPVISIQTPDILLPYYEQPEIILCDFEDYAKYFIWVRAFLSFSISFGFGLWFVNDIKKFFSQL